MSEFKIGDEVEAITDEYWDGMGDFTDSRLKVKSVFPNTTGGEDCILCECLDRDNKDLFGPVSKFRYVATESNK